MRPALASALLPALLLLAPHVAASCCAGSDCLGTLTVGSGRARDAMPTLYVDDRKEVMGNGIWVYLESNDVDDFQAGAQCSAIVPNDRDSCDEFIEPDTVIL